MDEYWASDPKKDVFNGESESSFLFVWSFILLLCLKAVVETRLYWLVTSVNVQNPT